ncbi:MAG: UbiD family decarboxylase [bacterium]|nr:UbiD family decarboxylase [bacterium]
MAYRNLDEFLVRLEQSGELVRVKSPVHPDLELSALTELQRTRDGGKALWFEQVEDSPFPVVVNLFGSARRMAWGLRVETLDALETRMAHLLDFHLPEGLTGMMSRAAELLGALRSAGIGVRTGGNNRARVQEVVCEGDVSSLPRVRLWPEDPPGALTHVQLIYTHSTGQRCMTLTQAHILDSRTLALPASALADLVSKTEHIPAAVVLGGDPAAMWCGMMPLPGGFDPYLAAGWLRGKPISFTRAVSQPLDLPADAEFAIEGWLDPTDVRRIGSISSDSGFYACHIDFIPLHVTALTHARDAIFPLHVPARPPSAHSWMLQAVERLYMPLLRLMAEDVVNMSLPAEGAGRNLAIVSINARKPGAAQKAMFGLWGIGELAALKVVMVVDADVNVHDPAAVMTRVLETVDWRQDILHVKGELHPHDFAAESRGFGGKMGIDATHKAERSPLALIEVESSLLDTLFPGGWHRMQRVILGSGNQPRMECVQPIWDAHPQAIIVFVDTALDLKNFSQAAWRILANLNTSRDLIINQHGGAAIDATTKATDWPPALEFPPAVIEQVQREWDIKPRSIRRSSRRK